MFRVDSDGNVSSWNKLNLSREVVDYEGTFKSGVFDGLAFHKCFDRVRYICKMQGYLNGNVFHERYYINDKDVVEESRYVKLHLMSARVRHPPSKDKC